MTTAERNKKSDSDAGLELKKSFVVELRRRMKLKQKLTPHWIVAREYGIHTPRPKGR